MQAYFPSTDGATKQLKSGLAARISCFSKGIYMLRLPTGPHRLEDVAFLAGA